MLRLRHLLCYLLIASILSLSLPQHAARAAMVSTEAVLEGTLEKRSDRDRIRLFLQRESVRAQVEAYGINPDEALARVESLNDQDVALILRELDTLPAGSGDTTIVVVLVVLLIAIMVEFVIIIGKMVAGTAKVVTFVIDDMRRHRKIEMRREETEMLGEDEHAPAGAERPSRTLER